MFPCFSFVLHTCEKYGNLLHSWKIQVFFFSNLCIVLRYISLSLVKKITLNGNLLNDQEFKQTLQENDATH